MVWGLPFGEDAFSGEGDDTVYGLVVSPAGIAPTSGLGSPDPVDTGAHRYWRIRITDPLAGSLQGVQCYGIDLFETVGGSSVLSGGTISASSESNVFYYSFPFNYATGDAVDALPGASSLAYWQSGNYDQLSPPGGPADANSTITYDFGPGVTKHIREIGWQPAGIGYNTGNSAFDPTQGVVEWSDDASTWTLEGNITFSFADTSMHRFTISRVVSVEVSGIAPETGIGDVQFGRSITMSGIAPEGGVGAPASGYSVIMAGLAPEGGVGSPVLPVGLSMVGIAPPPIPRPYVYANILAAPPEPAPDVLVYRVALPPQSRSDDPGVKWALGEFRKIEAVLNNMQKNGIQITDEAPGLPRKGTLYRAVAPWDPLGTGDAWVVWDDTADDWALAF